MRRLPPLPPPFQPSGWWGWYCGWGKLEVAADGWVWNKNVFRTMQNRFPRFLARIFRPFHNKLSKYSLYIFKHIFKPSISSIYPLSITFCWNIVCLIICIRQNKNLLPYGYCKIRELSCGQLCRVVYLFLHIIAVFRPASSFLKHVQKFFIVS